MMLSMILIFIQSNALRLAQLTARYVSTALVSLAVGIGATIKPEDEAGFTNILVSVVGALLFAALDHAAHWVNKKNDNDPPTRGQWAGMVMVGAMLLTFAGCKTSGNVNVSYDPVSGQPTIGASLDFKKKRAAEIAACKAATKAAMAANMKAFCDEQNRLAKECKLCEFVDVSSAPVTAAEPNAHPTGSPTVSPSSATVLPEIGTLEK